MEKRNEKMHVIAELCSAGCCAACYNQAIESAANHGSESEGGITMFGKKKPSQSEIDGVQYRRAKMWQIILYACNALVGMSVYSLINMASYSASIGYGISTAAVGVILTCTRILDGVTDPMLAFVYDRVNTRFGKLRVLLPKFGGQYNQGFLSAACWVCLGMGAVGTILVCIGVSAFDKPENFEGTTAKKEPLKLKDVWEVLCHNRALQCYIASNASDKIAQQVGSQAIIGTLLNGIIIGNMGLATILGVISMVPSIFFAAFGAKYVGKHGSKKGIVFWSVVSMVISIVTFGFFLVIDPKQIAVMGSVPIILYVVLTLAQNGSNMCITTANTSYMADTIDYELDRSGRYIPAVVSGSYSLIDKLITSFSAVIATGAVALIGYTTTMPQPGDPCTSGVFWLTMSIKFGLPILGWVVTLVAMKVCPLSKEEMVNVQKRIAEKKAAARHEFIEQELGAKVES